MLLPKARHPRNCRQSQSHAVAQLNLSAKLRCPGHRPGFYGMLYVGSENLVTGHATAILAGDHNARPGQSFECRRRPRHRKYPELPAFWLIAKTVCQLANVRRADSRIGVAKSPPCQPTPCPNPNLRAIMCPQVIIHSPPGSRSTRPISISIQVATRIAVDCPRPL